MTGSDLERRASTALARLDALHTGLTQIVLSGGNLAGIADEVARVLGVGVVFTSVDGREWQSALPSSARMALRAADYLDETGRVRVERLGEAGAAVGGGWLSEHRVTAGGTDLARLVCFRPEGRSTSDDVHALERAATVAALLITRQEAVTAVENKYQGDFLRDLLLRHAADPQYIAEHTETFGWDLDRPVVVVVAELDHVPGDEPTSSAQRRQRQQRFSAAWRQVTRSLDPRIACVDFSSEVVTLLPVEPAETDDGGHAIVGRTVTAVVGDRGGGRRPFSAGVSRIAAGIGDLPAAYGQARRAVEVGRRVNGGGSTTFFDQLGLHRLFALIPDTAASAAELQAFIRDALGPLAESTIEAADLRRSLQVLLDTNFNVAEAARLQFFHYNTMRYRLTKLERLLGPLSTDPQRRIDAAVALRFLEIAP